MISLSLMRDTLRPFLGSRIAEDPGFAESIAVPLQSYASWKDSFTDLSRRVEHSLFNALYDRLGPAMTLQMDDGTFRRILMTDLPALADAALFPLFASLKPYSVNFESLHAYWMATGSLAAMKALYLYFPAFLPPQEIFVMERIAEENLPEPQRSFWLPGKDEHP